MQVSCHIKVPVHFQWISVGIAIASRVTVKKCDAGADGAFSIQSTTAGAHIRLFGTTSQCPLFPVPLPKADIPLSAKARHVAQAPISVMKGDIIRFRKQTL